jgi:prepilin-type processing-associated H-X9-DG protein
MQGAGGSQAPEMTIGCAEEALTGVKANSLPTGATNVIVAGDVWMYLTITSPRKTLFEVCRDIPWPGGGCNVDPANLGDCPWAADCGLTYEQALQFWSDPSFRNGYTRHLSGSNFAFADGHAAWWNVYALMDKVRPRRDQSAVGTDGCPVILPIEEGSIAGFAYSDCPVPWNETFTP